MKKLDNWKGSSVPLIVKRNKSKTPFQETRQIVAVGKVSVTKTQLHTVLDKWRKTSDPHSNKAVKLTKT
jgi:hypothetical protein